MKVTGGSLILVGGAAGLLSSESFDLADALRNSDIGIASESNGIVGIVDQGPVQKNSRDPMVDITNNSPDSLTFTVALQTCSDGTLYDNDGESGCSVSFPLGSGSTKTVDIEASVTGTIPYDITVSDPDFSFSATRSVDAEAGNVKTAVDVSKPTKDKDFTSNTGQNNWTVEQVDVSDNDGDNDLDRVEYEVTEDSSGDIVGTKTVSNVPGDKYAPAGKGDATIEPDDNAYTISNGQGYTLKTTGYDADGNFTSTTVKDTA